MNLNPIKPNMTEVSIGEWTILFSYKTPVAARSGYGTLYTTQKRWSNTTTRHINKWVESFLPEMPNIISQPQEFFDNLIAEVK